MPTALPWSGTEMRSLKMRYRCASSLARWMSRWNLKAAVARAVARASPARHRVVQGVERGIQAAVILQVRLGDQRRHLFDGGEDGQFLPVGVPHQHFVEESEALERRLEPRIATRGAQRCGVDAGHILAECVVDGRYRIDRTRHDQPPLSSRAEVRGSPVAHLASKGWSGPSAALAASLRSLPC